jgi:hypothetical protein
MGSLLLEIEFCCDTSGGSLERERKRVSEIRVMSNECVPISFGYLFEVKLRWV